HVTQRLTELLAANEIEVAEGQPLLLEARYWEREEPAAQGTICELAARWIVSETPTPLWLGRFPVSAPGSPETPEAAAFNPVDAIMTGVTIPYFLPKEPGIPSLPVVAGF
ncbi:MAG: hypothetical protein HQ581_26065, partial [Planctomycetes bacterium]|nr:hypothetical protein [Planctomycetota bacterium]